MPRRAKIATLLPQELRKRLATKMIANAFAGYTPLSEWLAGHGYKISKSSINRYREARYRRGGDDGRDGRPRQHRSERFAQEVRAWAAIKVRKAREGTAEVPRNKSIPPEIAQKIRNALLGIGDSGSNSLAVPRNLVAPAGNPGSEAKLKRAAE